MNAAQVIADIEALGFSSIVDRWIGVSADASHRAKYLDLATWIPTNLERLERLELARPSRILDLGCGCGYFVHLAELDGHDAVGLDRAERDSIYTDIRHLLGVRMIEHSIKAFEPLPPIGTFDVVTAHMVVFNGHRTDALWGVGEWEWLLAEIPAPLWSIELNAEENGMIYQPSLRRFLQARGAQIRGHQVVIDAR